MPLHKYHPLCVVLLSVATALSGLAQSSPIVDLDYAQYQGAVSATNITHFLGIRYAAAPFGDLRFRAPQPPARVTGVQQALVQPNECFQTSKGLSPTNPLEARAAGDIEQTEDCLFLNVYFPSDAVGTPVGRLPVIVFIHGGGYLAGQASASNGEDIINQSNRGLVVVVIQYRLGLFGFLPGAEVKKDGTLNAGLRMLHNHLRLNHSTSYKNNHPAVDQDFALRWVNKHVHLFGGDASKVTIWGQSAGAGSVLQHVVANNGRTQPQLFRAAMTSSTFLPAQYHYDDPIPELSFSKVVAQSNCTSAANVMACLRSVDGDVLQAANIQVNNGAFFGTYTLVPVVDGTFITQSPTRSLMQGKINGEAILSVTNAFEGVKFVNQTTPANATKLALEVFPNFGPPEADRVGSLYAGLGTPLFQENALMGESIFICPTYLLLRAFGSRAFKVDSQHAKSGESSPRFLQAEFAIPPAQHANDLPYCWPSTTTPPFNNQPFIDAFAQSFTSFAISLNPNNKVDSTTMTPPWARWAEGHTEMLFNRTEEGVPVVRTFETDGALLRRCEFWASESGIVGQ
ncbi:Alpha/Beta hydrolase protein [Mycena filopes]|nr:Alpha/Beta hydrolase protein [Mycena filopes]